MRENLFKGILLQIKLKIEPLTLNCLKTKDKGKSKNLTTKYSQDSTCASKFALWFVGGWANLNALKSEHGDNHGSQLKHQCNDHQGTTCLYMT